MLHYMTFKKQVYNCEIKEIGSIYIRVVLIRGEKLNSKEYLG